MNNNLCPICQSKCYPDWNAASWEYTYCSLSCLKTSQNDTINKLTRKHQITKKELVELANELETNECLKYDSWKKDE